MDRVRSSFKQRLPFTGMLALMMAATAGGAIPGYEAEIQSWRTARETRLKAEGGWLSVAGLFWLKEGENGFGSDKGNEIVLPASAPARAGTFTFHSGETRFQMAAGVAATLAPSGKPASSGILRPDTARDAKEEEILKIGPLTMQVIERGGRYGIRLKDAQSAQRKAFAGLRWFPVKEAYRVTARFISAPTIIQVPNILGQVSDMPRPGYLVFTVNGQEVRLDPVIEEPGSNELFIIFRDETAPKETYGAGRFLYADMPRDGQVTLDFNKAYSPPCAFTPFATCPLPPKQNRLAVRIEAGELNPNPGH
jgi:uncharacterized protein (DUF1684 family)